MYAKSLIPRNLLDNIYMCVSFVNFPFLSSNIPTSPAYGVLQLIRYARACSSYWCLILRAVRLSHKLHEQGYVKERLKMSSRKFYGRYWDFIKHSNIITDSVVLWKIQKFDWLIPEIKWHSCLHNRALCSYLATLQLLRLRENNTLFSGTY